jgi:hypothetical protein
MRDPFMFNESAAMGARWGAGELESWCKIGTYWGDLVTVLSPARRES